MQDRPDRIGMVALPDMCSRQRRRASSGVDEWIEHVRLAFENPLRGRPQLSSQKSGQGRVKAPFGPLGDFAGSLQSAGRAC